MHPFLKAGSLALLLALSGGCVIVADGTDTDATWASDWEDSRATDRELARRVGERLEDDARLGLRDLTVQARRGVVTLRGDAPDAPAVAQAMAIAAEEQGVSRVVSRLVIEYQPH